MTGLVIPAEYSWNLLLSVLFVLQCFLAPFHVAKLRRQLFSAEFFAKNFPNLKNPPKSGYPDMGNGFYSQKLTLEQWTKFNNAQRVHYNYIEGLPLVVVLELVSGLFFPKYAAWAGIAYLVGRFLYGAGYNSTGPSGRSMGAGVFDVSLLSMLVMSFYGCIQLGGGIAGLKTLFTL